MVYSVPTPELEPGMTLAEPVTNRWGQILLNKGCTLTRRHISVLETWGISSVTIEEGKEMGSPPPLDLATLERISKKVRDRFLWRPVSPLEKVVFSLALEQAVRRFQLNQRYRKERGEASPEKTGRSAVKHTHGRRTG